MDFFTVENSHVVPAVPSPLDSPNVDRCGSIRSMISGGNFTELLAAVKSGENLEFWTHPDQSFEKFETKDIAVDLLPSMSASRESSFSSYLRGGINNRGGSSASRSNSILSSLNSFVVDEVIESRLKVEKSVLMELLEAIDRPSASVSRVGKRHIGPREWTHLLRVSTMSDVDLNVLHLLFQIKQKRGGLSAASFWEIIRFLHGFEETLSSDVVVCVSSPGGVSVDRGTPRALVKHSGLFFEQGIGISPHSSSNAIVFRATSFGVTSPTFESNINSDVLKVTSYSPSSSSSKLKEFRSDFDQHVVTEKRDQSFSSSLPLETFSDLVNSMPPCANLLDLRNLLYPGTWFAEKLFKICDVQRDGMVNCLQFSIAIATFCSVSRLKLSALAFEVLVDQSGIFNRDKDFISWGHIKEVTSSLGSNDLSTCLLLRNEFESVFCLPSRERYSNIFYSEFDKLFDSNDYFPLLRNLFQLDFSNLKSRLKSYAMSSLAPTCTTANHAALRKSRS